MCDTLFGIGPAGGRKYYGPGYSPAPVTALARVPTTPAADVPAAVPGEEAKVNSKTKYGFKDDERLNAIVAKLGVLGMEADDADVEYLVGQVKRAATLERALRTKPTTTTTDYTRDGWGSYSGGGYGYSKMPCDHPYAARTWPKGASEAYCSWCWDIKLSDEMIDELSACIRDLVEYIDEPEIREKYSAYTDEAIPEAEDASFDVDGIVQ